MPRPIVSLGDSQSYETLVASHSVQIKFVKDSQSSACEEAPTISHKRRKI